MILTEDEARKKWCPFARRLWSDDVGRGLVMTAINRLDDNTSPGGCNCIASECMAWRWIARKEYVFESAGFTKGRIATHFNAPDESDDAHTTWTIEKKNTEPSHGYCGLAGKAKVW